MSKPAGRKPRSITPASVIAQRYVLESELGSGHFGTVYLAYDRLANRTVALKLLHPDRWQGAAIDRLQNEFKAFALLRHPRIAQAYDFGYADEHARPFYTREHIEGSPLEPGPPPPRTTPAAYLQPILDVLEGLEHVHGRGILHLDVHPGNVIVASDFKRGSVLIDFGLALRNGNGQLPMELARSLPPHIFAAGKPTAAIDVVLAARLLRYRLTGAFDGEPRLPLELSGWSGRVTLELERLLARALDLDSTRGFHSAGELRGALQSVLGLKGSHGNATAGPGTRLVGMEKQLRDADETLDKVSRGTSQCLWISGDSGSGKSWLLAELRLSAQLRGLAVVEATNDKQSAEPVLGRALRGVGGSRRATPAWASLLAPIFGGTPEERARRAAQAFVEANRAPLAILVDDFDAMDRESQILAAAIWGEALRLGERGSAPGLALIVTSSRLPEASFANSKVVRLRGWRRKRAQFQLTLPEQAVLEALLIADQPLRRDEIRQATKLSAALVATVLTQLTRKGVVALAGRAGTHRLALREDCLQIVERLPSERKQMLHRRLAKALESRRSPSAADLEHVARHLLLGGSERQARRIGLRAIAGLAAGGSFDRAVSLLEQLLRRERGLAGRLALADKAGELLEVSGDHAQGIEILEPMALDGRRRPSTPKAVRLLRRLGIHYHRNGQSERALAIFREVEQRANPDRDFEDLVFVDAELAELHLFRGDVAAAEAASRRGLSRLQSSGLGAELRGRMGVVLRASLGHTALRRLHSEQAREELTLALKLGRQFGLATDVAAILLNLGAAENSLDCFEAARRHFLEAESVFLKVGDRRNAARAATNLAVLEAKLGNAKEARERLDQALALVAASPAKQLEFFARFSAGLVALLLGDPALAIESFLEALPLGRKLGDRYLVAFGEVYLAEAWLLEAKYADALRQLQQTLRAAATAGPPVLRRILQARLAFLEALLGRPQAARRHLQVLAEIPRSQVRVLEAWNDLFAGLAGAITGAASTATLEAAAETFGELGLKPARAQAALALVFASLLREDVQQAERLMREQLDPLPVESPFLRVAAAVARVWIHDRLGQTDSAQSWLHRATTAIAGNRFPELDWQIEALSALLAKTRGDPSSLKHHVHRALHARDYLAELAPPSARRAFLRRPLFVVMDDLATRLRGAARPPSTAAFTAGAESYQGIVGQSSVMVRTFQEIERLRNQDLPVLITGETGSGKDLVVRALYRTSLRAEKSFEAVHCASLPESLLDAEIFGHEAGAFTGAEEARAGLLERLDGGTLLLDEIAELPLSAQAKLLRALDTGVVRRLGAIDNRKVDVRFLFTSTASIDQALRLGKLRNDFLQRLRFVEIAVAPLRERKDDLPLLVRHFLQRHAVRLARQSLSIDPDAMALLEKQPWPGNVRELESVLFRSALSSTNPDRITCEGLEQVLTDATPERSGPALTHRPLAEWQADLDRRYLLELFAEVGGNVSRMCERLQVQRATLYAWFRRLAIDPGELRGRLG